MDVFNISDIIAYAIFTGFEFAALCAFTRIGRGWPLQLLGLGVLVGVDVLLEWWWQLGLLHLDAWVSVCFLFNWGAVAAMTLCLSRECLGRRVFLSLAYGAYAVCFVVVFHLLAYRNIFGLSETVAGLVGLAVVAVMNLALVFWILPWMPRESRVSRWRDPCIAAGAVFANMFACGLWPISAVTAPVRYGLAFALASVAAWVAFPMLCRSMRERLHNADVERRFEQLMAEVKERRTALDEARRLRHDQRHHRIVIADLLLRNRPKEALAYVNALDREGAALAGSTEVWCRNETVNAILAGAVRKAAALGVGFSAEAHVERTIPLPDTELVSLVANLVENAVEACGGEVTCVLRQRGDMFGLTVRNPVPEGFSLSPAGWPCAEWGVGLASVGRIVAKYSGEWRYRLENGLLTCSVAICAGEKR